MTRTQKFRLSAMMFLEYVVPGATVPILSHYLKNYLHFEPYQAGIVMGMPAAAAMVAPLVASRLADRYLSAEKMVILCHLLCAGVMVSLFGIKTFPVFLCVYFVYGLCFTPTFGLTNTVALHYAADARRDFGGIRAWGTVGWVLVAWFFGYGWLAYGDDGSRLPHAFLLSAGVSLILAAYMFTFPPSKLHPDERRSMRYREVLRLFRRPDMLLLFIVAFFNSACHQVYYFGMGPYMSQLGYSNHYIMPAMSLGQMTEVLLLSLLGWCLTRLTMKQAMILGILAQAVRSVMFILGRSMFFLLGGISLHGPCYALFFTTAYLYAERHSTSETRAGAQQLLTIAISGCGTLAGFLLGGFTAQVFTLVDGQIDFQRFWLVPTVFSLIIAIALALLFREQPKAEA